MMPINLFGRPRPANQGKSRAQTECKFYQETGSCGYGERCYYKHSSKEAVRDSEFAPSSHSVTSSSVPKKICKYWQSGTCGRGQKCWFSHIVSEEIEASSEIDSQENSSSTAVGQDDDGICWAWKAKKCWRTAEACRYQHEDPEKSRATLKSPTLDAEDTYPVPWRRIGAEGERVASLAGSSNDTLEYEDAYANWAKKTVCKYWKMQGWCSRGDSCSFQHHGDYKSKLQDDVDEALKPFKIMPCRFWKVGDCYRGDSCTYIHEASTEILSREDTVQSKNNAKEVKWKQELAVTDRRIVMDKNLVTLGAGLNVQAVLPSFEICKIIVKGLPLDASQEAIEGLLIERGAAPEDVFIPYRTRPAQDGSGEALLFVNTSRIPNIIDRLQGATLDNQHLEIQNGDQVNNASTGKTAGVEDEAPYLEVSWKAPTETVFAQYSSPEEAKRRAEELNGKMWEGRRINATVEEQHATSFGRGRGGRFGGLRARATTGVKLMGCPMNSSENPRFAEFAGSNQVAYHSVSPWSCKSIVREHLAERKGILMDTYKILADEDEPFVKVKVNFRAWDDVILVHSSLDNQKLGIYGGKTPLLRATFPARHRYQVTIPMRQYRAQKKQWDALPAWSLSNVKEAYVKTETTSGDRGAIVSISVFGEDEKAAGALKVRVEGLVAGETLGATYWHPIFGQNETTRALCDRIYTSTAVYTRVDFKARALKMFGEPSMTAKAKAMVQEELGRLEDIETTRVIDWAGGVGFFVREGLSRLKEMIGEEYVRLDLSCRPAKITIQGGEEARYDLDRIIEEAKMLATAGVHRKIVEGGDICPICTENVSNGEELGCGHTYCSGCLKHFISSAVDTKVFPLVCLGDDTKCGSPITIPFLRRFVRHQTLSKLAEAAFVGHMETHPHELKYCTTPDCRQIYRREIDQTSIQCPSCLSEICATCDKEAHTGISCEGAAAKQAQTGDGELTKAGCKKCPGCSTWIEKSSGCNHMHCGHCGVHFCWVCVQAFDRREVYEHMRREHGGIYGEMLPEGVEVGQAGVQAFVVEQANLFAAFL